MNKRSLAARLLAIVSLAVFASCAGDPTSWYPSGSATIVSAYDSGDSLGMGCAVTVAIANTGSSKIASSTISISVKTAARDYLKTLSVTMDIIPGKTAYASTLIPYAAATETMTPGSAAIVGQYYE